MGMALNRRSEHGQKLNDSASRVSSVKLPDDYIRHLKETTTVDQIFQEVNIRPLTPIRDASKEISLDLSLDDEGECSSKDDSSVAASSSSDSSNSDTSDDSSSDSESSDSAESASSKHRSLSESRTLGSFAPKDSLNPDCSAGSQQHLWLNPNDSGISSVQSTGSSTLKFRISSYDSSSQLPSLPSSSSSSDHHNGLATTQKTANVHQPTLNSGLSLLFSSAAAAPSGVAAAAGLEPGAGSSDAIAPTAGAVPAPVPPAPKKAPLSPGAMSKLTGMEIKPLPKTNFMKKRATADDSKPNPSKRPKTDRERKLPSALQRAYSPERVPKKDQTSAQFGEHWDSEFDGSLQEFEPSDYIISERLPIEQNHDSTGKDLAESGSDAAESKEESSDSVAKRAQKRRKNIGDIWGSMVTKAEGPTEDYHDPWGRRPPAQKPRRSGDFHARRRDFPRGGGGGDESIQSKGTSDRERDRGRDRDWDRERDKDRGRDYHRRTKHATKSTHTQTDDANTDEKRTEDSRVEIGVQTSKAVNSSDDLFLASSNVYSDQAYDLKSHADTMPDGLMKLLCYTKSTILLIQETYALEREKTDVKDISAKLQQLVNFSKSYTEIITHQLSQDPERLWAILNVFTLQIQCFLFSRIFSLRRNEVTRARTKLDDLLMEMAKSSDPSPTESRASSAKVSLRPPTVPESQSFQFYVKYMEMMNRCYTYNDRAENFIRKSSRVNEFYTKLRHDVGQLHIDSCVSFFLAYCAEALHRLGYEECCQGRDMSNVK